jgi:hypothetical protein
LGPLQKLPIFPRQTERDGKEEEEEEEERVIQLEVEGAVILAGHESGALY